MSGRRAIGFAMLVCVAVAACSSPEAIRTSGQSWGATAETVTAEWLAGQLPTPYTALVLRTARDRLADLVNELAATDYSGNPQRRAELLELQSLRDAVEEARQAIDNAEAPAVRLARQRLAMLLRRPASSSK